LLDSIALELIYKRLLILLPFGAGAAFAGGAALAGVAAAPPAAAAGGGGGVLPAAAAGAGLPEVAAAVAFLSLIDTVVGVGFPIAVPFALAPGVGFAPAVPLTLVAVAFFAAGLGGALMVKFNGFFAAFQNRMLQKWLRKFLSLIESYQSIYVAGVAPHSYTQLNKNLRGGGFLVVLWGITSLGLTKLVA
jgi:hypothetical protein